MQTAPAAKIIVSVQLPMTMRDELIRRAEEADRTFSAEIRRALSEHLSRYEQTDEGGNQ